MFWMMRTMVMLIATLATAISSVHASHKRAQVGQARPRSHATGHATTPDDREAARQRAVKQEAERQTSVRRDALNLRFDRDGEAKGFANAGHSSDLAEAIDELLDVKLRIRRGRPGQFAAFRLDPCDLSPGDRALDARTTARPVPAVAAIGCALRPGLAACGWRACRPGGGAAPGGLPPVRARQAAAPESASCPRPPPGIGLVLMQLRAIPRCPRFRVGSRPRPDGPARRRRAFKAVELSQLRRGHPDGRGRPCRLLQGPALAVLLI